MRGPQNSFWTLPQPPQKNIMAPKSKKEFPKQSQNGKLELKVRTSIKPQPQIKLSLNLKLNPTSTLTSTEYGWDIKATNLVTYGEDLC